MEIQKLKISEQDRKSVSSFMGEEYPSEIDFNLLMPVVEKIHDECKLYSDGLKFFSGLTIFSTKEQVLESCINFINWYNEK